MDKIPLPVLADSYKACHALVYPPSIKMVAYGEFRCSYENDPIDHRIIFFGLRYILDNYIAKQWTRQDLDIFDKFLSTHNVSHSPFPYPKRLFERIIEEFNGWFPVRIEALDEGSIIAPHVPVYTITAEKDFAPLVTFLETILTMVWYPSTVATLSKRCKDVIEDAFNISTEDKDFHLLDSRLHDFGFRACTSPEQALIGGMAHLINFSGSDTMIASYYSQYFMNNEKAVGQSIPASEHSVMTAFSREKDAFLEMIKEFGQGLFACVMDSYDYIEALEEILPSIASVKLERGGFMILRPDSGDPSTVVLQALYAAEKVFGSTINQKGFKVLNGAGVIQGDSVDYQEIKKILNSVIQSGFSAQNVAFGMGGSLLHRRVHRDTMSMATKLSSITYSDGSKRDLRKTPKTDSSKFSLPGEFSVRLVEMEINGNENEIKTETKDYKENEIKTENIKEIENIKKYLVPMVFPKETEFKSLENGNGNQEELLKVWYDHGPVQHALANRPTFDQIREKVKNEWKNRPKKWDPLSREMKEKTNKMN